LIDAVSASQAATELCQGFTYSVTDVPEIGVVALSSQELVIDFVLLTVAIFTDSNLTLGKHTVALTAKLTSYP